MTWKCTVAVPSKTPQECVEQNRIPSAKPIQNGNHKGKPGMDRHPQNTRQTHGNVSRTLGTARLAKARQPFGVSKRKYAKQ